MARLMDMRFPFLRNWDKVLLRNWLGERFCGDELACRLVHLVAGLVTLPDSQIRRATFWIRYYRAEKEVAYGLAGEGLVTLKLFPRRYSCLGGRGM
jgi:hypothetical protein